MGTVLCSSRSTLEYLEKGNGILSDTTRFQLIGDASTHDNTLQQERSPQAFLLRAKQAGHISSEMCNHIRPFHLGMYDVPKMHKDGNLCIQFCL